MALQISQTIDINAPPERVWAVMTEVERWPDWTESMKSVERLEEGPPALGSTANLRTRRPPTATLWTVTELTPERSFSWESTNSAGGKATATHALQPDRPDSKDTLSLAMLGI